MAVERLSDGRAPMNGVGRIRLVSRRMDRMCRFRLVSTGSGPDTWDPFGVQEVGPNMSTLFGIHRE
jgi:hypothetical protein